MSLDIAHIRNRIAEIKSNHKDPKSSNLNVDKKTFERCWRHMDKLVKVCQEPRLSLKHSPPYILDIIPDTYKHMKLIQTTYDSKWSQLSSNVYFNKFLSNLILKVQLCTSIMSSSELQIYNEESEARSEFTKLCLIFSHIFTELKALFPEGFYVGDSFRITKNDAHSWWKKIFKDRTIVSWEEFKHELLLVHPLSEIEFNVHNHSQLITNLKETIDLTRNEHVSIFEFDVFTRLFQPWHSLVRNWYILAVTHPGYGAFLTYDEVKAKLTAYKNKPGSYIYRLSCTRLGQWAIGYVTKEGNILQTIPLNKSLGQALLEGEKAKYYLYPSGLSKNQDIRMLAEAVPNNHIAVTEEQYDIYCGMGSSFEQCKICTENDKDVRIEPCGHLLCSACLSHWQSNSGATCPFCRSPIKGTEPIVIDPFKNAKEPPLPNLAPPPPPSICSSEEAASTASTEEKRPPPPNPRPIAVIPPVMAQKPVSNNLKTLSDNLGAVGGPSLDWSLPPPILFHRKKKKVPTATLR